MVRLAVSVDVKLVLVDFLHWVGHLGDFEAHFVDWVDAAPSFFQKQREFFVGYAARACFVDVVKKFLYVIEANLEAHVVDSLRKFIQS